MSDSSVLHAIAGAGAGCASLALTYPLYARMVRQQVHTQTKADSEASAAAAAAAGQLSAPCSAGCIPSLSDALGSLRALLTAEGLAPHFSGLSAALYAITIQSGCYYYFFQYFKNLHGVSTSPLGNVLTGTEAGIATVLLTNSLWVVNARQITFKRAAASPPPQLPSAAPALVAKHDSPSSSSSPSAETTVTDGASSLTSCVADLSRAAPPTASDSQVSSASAVAAPSSSSSAGAAAVCAAPLNMGEVSFFAAFRALVAQEGLAGLYSGVGPALALVSSPALQFASYEYLKALLLKARNASASANNSGAAAARALTNMDFFWLGAVSKILATLATYPIQTLKSQLQKDASPYARMGLFAGVWACISDMARSEQGLPSFYRGLKAKILQTGLTSAFLFVFRERLIWILTKIVQAHQASKAIAP